MSAIEREQELYDLVSLKFCIEHEYTTINDARAKINDFTLKNKNCSSDINEILSKYRSNIETTGKEFIKNQKQLHAEIEKVLLNECNHTWIYDVVDEPFTSRDICYCDKCFIYK